MTPNQERRSIRIEAALRTHSEIATFMEATTCRWKLVIWLPLWLGVYAYISSA